MHDRLPLILARVDRTLRERIRPAVHQPIGPVRLSAWHLDGEPVPPGVALDPARAGEFRSISVGDGWGPPWGTTWFRLEAEPPAMAAEVGAWDDGDRCELVVDLGWTDDQAGFQAEGLVYRPDGSVIKAVNPKNQWIPVEPEGPVSLYLEAAANPNLIAEAFRPTTLGDPATAGSSPLYRVQRIEVCRWHRETWQLMMDLEVADGLARALPESDPMRHELGFAMERALDALDLADLPGTAGRARSALAPQLSRPAGAHTHRISAVGHAHIDSAWLWPARETVRKVARTVANVVQLMDDNPDLVYAMSSAQQYAWIEQDRPEVFDRLREKVAGGQFVPVGGMWVESDANLVGGEAMVRQFLYGKRYFLEKFGVEPTEVWLPDSFGYSAALPQICLLAGCTAFVTQKMSWNRVNRFPHHTFWWEGIDGSRIFTHLPPSDTYSSDVSPGELRFSVDNFRDKGRATRSLLLFGYGDGGGGPTREMLARARRTADLAGSPRVDLESPAQFFAAAKAENPDAPVWVGEMYLEIHRGTFTTQSKTKQGNRRAEHLLREAEFWSATAALRGRLDYPYDRLEEAWKVVLLQQFHDILPGSSIAWVHREAVANYARVTADLESMVADALAALTGAGTVPLLANSAPVALTEPTAVPAMEVSPVARTVGDASIDHTGDDLLLTNGRLRVRLDAAGIIRSLVVVATNRELIPPAGAANLLQLHPDHPVMWDAWDIDPYYRTVVTDLDTVETLDTAVIDGAATVTVTRVFGSSRVRQTIVLAPGSAVLDLELDLDWHESERVLKLAFDVDVHTDSAVFETQFGHVRRPTHQNTSWDEARFEVWAHRWVHVGEPGCGVALANDSSYGYDVTRHAHPAGGTFSRVRASVIRAPRFPDPHTDQGRHVMRYALQPGAEIADAVALGYRLNLPVRRVTGAHSVPPLVSTGPGVLIEAVKLAEDRSGDVVIRLYEPYGARTGGTVTASFDLAAVTETDLLERPVKPTSLTARSGRDIAVTLRPFQIVTLRLTPAA
jgi:alpha-mannosidase